MVRSTRGAGGGPAPDHEPDTVPAPRGGRDAGLRGGPDGGGGVNAGRGAPHRPALVQEAEHAAEVRLQEIGRVVLRSADALRLDAQQGYGVISSKNSHVNICTSLT